MDLKYSVIIRIRINFKVLNCTQIAQFLYKLFKAKDQAP